jgi:hypothetical protein
MSKNMTSPQLEQKSRRQRFKNIAKIFSNNNKNNPFTLKMILNSKMAVRRILGNKNQRVKMKKQRMIIKKRKLTESINQTRKF